MFVFKLNFCALRKYQLNFSGTVLLPCYFYMSLDRTRTILFLSLWKYMQTMSNHDNAKIPLYRFGFSAAIFSFHLHGPCHMSV
jgi:hypothetical protein